MKIFLKKTILLISVILIILISNVTHAAFTEPTTAPSSSDQDFPQNILGANNNNNDFDSTNVTANNDGSLIERLEYIITSLSSLWTKVGNLLYYNTGNVGIGTSTPSALLEVSGDGQSALKVTDVTNSITTGIWSGTTQGSIGTLTNTDLRFLTNGTSKMTIDTSGNVGVGTTGPESKLDIKADDSFTIRDNDSNKLAYIGQSGAGTNVGYLNLFHTAGTVGTHIRGSGDSYFNNSNVGIGTVTPGAKLHITADNTYSSDAILLQDANTAGGIRFRDIDDDEQYQIGIKGNSGSGYLGIWADQDNDGFTRNVDSPKMVITNSGKVGIGTTNPGGPLGRGTYRDSVGVRTAPTSLFEMVGTAGSSELILTSFHDDVGKYPVLTLRKADADQSWPHDNDITGVINFAANDSSGAAGENEWMDVASIIGRLASDAGNNGASGDLEFWTSSGGMTSSQRMVILANGTVGIGTTGPSAPLTISGANASWRGQLMIRDTTTGNNADPYISFWSGSETGSDSTGLLGYVGYVSSSDNLLSIGNYMAGAGGPLSLNQWGGNVGVGMTAPTSNFDVKGTSGLYDSTGAATTQPIYQEIAFSKTVSGNTAVDVARVTLPDNYSQGYVEFVMSGENSGGVEGRIFAKRFYYLNASTANFTTIGTDDTGNGQTVTFVNDTGNAFKIQTTNSTVVDKKMGVYIRVYGGGSDGATTYTGVVSITPL